MARRPSPARVEGGVGLRRKGRHRRVSGGPIAPKLRSEPRTAARREQELLAHTSPARNSCCSGQAEGCLATRRRAQAVVAARA